MSSITLSNQQKAAVDKLAAWYHASIRDKKTFILNGFAGTGKSTLARLLPELVLNADQTACTYTSLTGKAALQLRKKGCEKVTTLHKLLYSPLEKDRQRLVEITQALKKELETSPQGDSVEAKRLKSELYLERKRVATPSWQIKKPDLHGTRLIVVDESSMVDHTVYNDLMSFDTPILFMGDPFQLPPVFGTSPVMAQEPDFVLTEVHRQGLESPILRAATALRSGQYPDPADNTPEFKLIDSSQATYHTYASCDQVLCGRNKTRRSLNAKLRKKLVEQGAVGKSALPIAVGDRVVFLRNDHDENIFNGSIAKVESVTPAAVDGGDHAESLLLDAQGDDGSPILGYEVWQGVVGGQDIHEAPRKCQVVDYAYALTVHKAQGSEWPSVCVHAEPMAYGTDALRWLYTAVTRAQDTCTVVTREE